MLREFVEKKHVKFADSAPDWREAIRMSCEVLEADGTIEENYKEDIIACVEKIWTLYCDRAEHCDAAFSGGCKRSA